MNKLNQLQHFTVDHAGEVSLWLRENSAVTVMFSVCFRTFSAKFEATCHVERLSLRRSNLAGTLFVEWYGLNVHLNQIGVPTHGLIMRYNELISEHGESALTVNF